MKSFKTVLAATAAAIISLTLLAGCTAQSTTPNYVAVPKTARYGTGLMLDKKITTLQNDRNLFVSEIEHAVGTSKNKADANAFIYNNITVSSYDLGANSPYFVNKSRTTVKCPAGKAQGTDVGDGYYVVGDSFITPRSGFTLDASKVNSELTSTIKSLISSKSIITTYQAASKGAGKYQFTLKDGSMLQVKTTVTGSQVSMIRVTTVLQPTTCYNLNTLPYTTAKAVSAWRTMAAKAGAF